MARITSKALTLAELSKAYRLSFKDFVGKLRRLQSLEAIPEKDEIELAIASLELERAWTAYYSKRDALVEELLPSNRMGHVQVLPQSGWHLAHHPHS